MAFPSADVKVEKFIIIKYASYTLVLFPTVSSNPANTLRSHSKAAGCPKFDKHAHGFKGLVNSGVLSFFAKYTVWEARDGTAEFPLYALRPEGIAGWDDH